jgi:ribosome-interacting GTPase 1
MENLELDINALSNQTAVTPGDAGTQVQPAENQMNLAEFKNEVQETAIQAGTTPTEEGVYQIGKIQSALYGGFIKILSFLSAGTTSQDIIHIREGNLNLVKNAGYIYADLSIFFEDHDLDIIDPTKNTKLLSLIKGGDEVMFVKDNNNSRYLITSLVNNIPSTSITLPQAENQNNMQISAPELGELKLRRELEIDLVETIQNASKAVESDYLKFELDSNYNIISISTSDDIFKQELMTSTEETKVYKIFNPFAFAKPDELYIEFYENNGEAWVKTISAIGMVNLEYSEKIEEVGEFDTFAL